MSTSLRRLVPGQHMDLVARRDARHRRRLQRLHVAARLPLDQELDADVLRPVVGRSRQPRKAGGPEDRRQIVIGRRGELGAVVRVDDDQRRPAAVLERHVARRRQEPQRRLVGGVGSSAGDGVLAQHGEPDVGALAGIDQLDVEFLVLARQQLVEHRIDQRDLRVEALGSRGPRHGELVVDGELGNPGIGVGRNVGDLQRRLAVELDRLHPALQILRRLHLEIAEPHRRSATAPTAGWRAWCRASGDAAGRRRSWRRRS